MKKLFLIAFILVFQFNNAQIDPNSLLILNSGTTTEINATTPNSGALAYNTDNQKVYVFNGTTWALATGTNENWVTSGNNQYSAVSGNVGIGTSSPLYKLDIREVTTAAGVSIQEAVRISSTVPTSATNNYGIYSNATPTSTGNVSNNYSIFGDINMPAGATANNIYGVYGRSLIRGSVGNSYGMLGISDVISGGVVNQIRGAHFSAKSRTGATVNTAYGIYSSAQQSGVLSNANYGSYTIARPLSGSTVNSNFGSYHNASIPAGGSVILSNHASYSNADVFGTVLKNNYGSYNLARIRNGAVLTKSNFGVFANTNHINGTVTGSNFGLYSTAASDASSSVGTNYAGYFNADQRGNVVANNFGIYAIAKTRDGAHIGGNNYAGYFYAAASNTGGSYGTIDGNNFGLRVIMSSQGVGSSTYGIYQTGDTGTENYFQNTVGINTTGGSGVLNVNGVATKTGGGVWTVFSDQRSKENINSYTKGLRELLQLRPVSFNYKKSFGFGTETHVGFIAQEVEKIAPTMVTEADMHGLKDFKQVDTNEVTFMLINAIKELKAENESLKKRFEKIENTLINSQKK